MNRSLKKRKAPTNYKVYAPIAQVLSCGCIRLSKTIYLDRCSSQYKEVNKMQELNYPFDPSYIIKKRKSIKRELLADGSARIKKKIAVFGGSTTNEIIILMSILF